MPPMAKADIVLNSFFKLTFVKRKIKKKIIGNKLSWANSMPTLNNNKVEISFALKIQFPLKHQQIQIRESIQSQKVYTMIFLNLFYLKSHKLNKLLLKQSLLRLQFEVI